MVTSSAVVGSSAMQQLRRAGQRHGDDHPLLHAAGELVRILAVAGSRGCPPSPAFRRFSSALLLAATFHAGADEPPRSDRPPGVDRVQAGHRVLERSSRSLLPRICRSLAGLVLASRSSPSKRISPPMIFPGRLGRCSRRIDRAVVVLPAPVSPDQTQASRPCPMVRSRPLTA